MNSSAGRSFRVVAVQPQWHAQDFTSAGRFRAWMRSQLELARPHIAGDRPTLVVLTELNGLPLVLSGAGWATRLGTFRRAATALFVVRLPRTLPLLLRERVSPIRALQLADADTNAELYLRTCQALAREYGVYLCCGSAPLPRYYRQGRRVRRVPGVLTNQTVILAPDGHLIGATDKVHLTPDEQTGGVDLTPGDLNDMHVYPTPVGDLGVAISLDAFREDVLGHLGAQGCTVLLQPDANGAPWTSLEGLPPDPAQLRDQPLAWLDSSWKATTGGRVRYAVNPMVVGNLLDMTFDGQSAITGAAHEGQPQSYALTGPRGGFLALMPWVETGPPEQLRETGRQLAAGSGHPHENLYRTGVLSADLHLPPSQVTPPTPTAHEEALAALLNGEGEWPRPTRSGRPAAWLALLGLIASLTWARRRRDGDRGRACAPGQRPR